MATVLQIDQMTTEEKLQTMEALWKNLTRDPEEFTSPAWHETVLKQRAERMKSGLEPSLDWEQAKSELRDLQK
jgi:hypothetical protein